MILHSPHRPARPLRRAIQRLIEDPLADFVLGRSMTPGATIVVKRRNEEEVEIEVIPPSSPPEPAAVGAPAASGEPEGDEPSEPAAG